MCHPGSLFCVVHPPAPSTPLSPYTTLFRSCDACRRHGLGTGVSQDGHEVHHGADHDKGEQAARDRKSTRLNSSHVAISYAVFCLKKKTTARPPPTTHCTLHCTPRAVATR